MMSQQKLGLMHVLRMLPVDWATLLPGASCYGPGLTWCSAWPALLPPTASSPSPTRKWEDSCLTSTSTSTIQGQERGKIHCIFGTVRIAMLCCSFGEAPKYPLLHTSKTLSFSSHLSSSPSTSQQGSYSFKVFSIIFFLSGTRSSRCSSSCSRKSSSPQSTIGTSKSSSYSSFMLLKHIISFICSISCTSSCIHVHAHSRTHFT